MVDGDIAIWQTVCIVQFIIIAILCFAIARLVTGA